MTHFPVSSSVLSEPHLAALLAERYALGAGVKCGLLRAGINHSYKVETSDQLYMLRVYSLSWRTHTEICAEIDLLKMLKDAGIPVSYALPDINGQYIQAIYAPEGERYAVLFSYAQGDKAHNYDADKHTLVGEVMAALHLNTVNKTIERTTYTPEILLDKPLRELSFFLPDTTEEMVTMHAMQQYLHTGIASAKLEDIRQGIVHLDIWFDNLNITAEGKVTLFDFDFCGNGWLCLDVAYYLMQLYFTEPNEVDYNAKAAAFLHGYEAITPLSAEEKRLLPLLGVSLYFYYVGVQCNRFSNYSSVFVSATYLKRFISQRISRYFHLHKLDRV